jgi:ketosteroid isomerase-like protein
MGGSAVSEANVNLVKGAYQSFQQGDMAGLLATMTPNVDWELVGNEAHFPSAGPRRGHERVRDFFRTVAETLDFHEFSPREFYDCGDKVFVLGHYDATIKKTGRRAASDWVHVFTVANGKVVRFREFTDTATFAEAWRD